MANHNLWPREVYKVGKHLVLDIDADSSVRGEHFDYRRDEKKIAAEAALEWPVCDSHIRAGGSVRPLTTGYGRTPRELKFAARCTPPALPQPPAVGLRLAERRSPGKKRAWAATEKQSVFYRASQVTRAHLRSGYRSLP